MGGRTSLDRALRLSLTRRRLLWLSCGSLLAACRRNQATSPTTVTASDATPLPSPTPPQRPLTPTPTPTLVAVVPTPSPRPTPTPAAARIFVRLRLDEPKSHDFNADAACGGEPELFAGLVRLASDYSVQPDWAAAWEVSADGTRYVFSLRSNRSGWSNGDPVRASDFVWSWQRMLDPARPAPQASLLDLVGNGKAVREGRFPPEQLAVRALDEWTLEVELERPAGYFLWILGTPGLLPAHRPSVERWGARWTEAGRCVSNGPFFLASWEPGSGYTVNANPHYWNRPSLDSCTVTIAASTDPLLPFYRGQVDFAAVPHEELPRVTGEEALLKRVERSILPETWFLVIQPDGAPLDDPELRRALSRAIDRDRLRQLLYGAVEPASSLVPPGIPGNVRDDSVTEAHRFAPLEAFLAWQRVRASDPRPLRLTAPAECSPDEETILQDVALQLTSNLGVPVELVRLAAREWERAVEEGTFELLWWRWSLPFPDAAAVYEWLLSSERRRLRGLRWRSDALDRLLALARGETVLTRRLGAYRQCERLAQEEFVLLPICHPVATYLVQPWVVTLPRTPTGELLGPDGSFSRFLSAVALSSRGS